MLQITKFSKFKIQNYSRNNLTGIIIITSWLSGMTNFESRDDRKVTWWSSMESYDMNVIIFLNAISISRILSQQNENSQKILFSFYQTDPTKMIFFIFLLNLKNIFAHICPQQFHIVPHCGNVTQNATYLKHLTYR